MSGNETASRRELLAMAAVAVGLRAVLFLIATSITGTTFGDYARAADGYQYIAYARAWLGDDPEFEAHRHFGRFPGYPMLIAALHGAGVPIAAASLLPSWLAAGGIAVLGVLCFRDRRAGWALAVLTPSFLFSGSLISTEAPSLLLSLAGLLLALRGKAALAGIAFGLGGLFRPMAVFAMIGAAAAKLVEGRVRQAAVVVALAGATVLAGLGAIQWRFGEALMMVRSYTVPPPVGYGGDLHTWPFRSLIETPLTTPVATWKLLFVGAHVAAVLVGCALAVREWRRAAPGERPLAIAALLWLWANTLYVSSVGDVWGFHEFPRFLVPALPPLFWVYRRILPARLWLWAAVAALSLALAIEPTVRRLRELPPVFAGRSPR